MESLTLMFGRFAHVDFGDRTAEWERWYDTGHIAARLAVPGIRAAHRFTGIHGGMASLAFYEATSPDVFTGDSYRMLRENEDTLPETSWERVSRKLPGFERSAYTVAGGAPFSEFLDAQILGLVGIDRTGGNALESEQSRGEINAAVLEALVTAVPGARKGWILDLAPPGQGPPSGTMAASPETIFMVDGSQDASADNIQRAVESVIIPVGLHAAFRVTAERRFPRSGGVACS